MHYVPKSLSNVPNYLPCPIYDKPLWKNNQTVCFDQPLDWKDCQHFGANVVFNISRMFEPRLKGIAQHNSFQALIVSTLVKM